jgi:hypothetical protein
MHAKKTRKRFQETTTAFVVGSNLDSRISTGQVSHVVAMSEKRVYRFQ